MSKLQRGSTHVGDPRPRVFSSFDAVLSIASVLATVALPVLFWGILPGLHKRYFVHLDHVQARLAFPIRFALERHVAWAVVLVGLGLTLSGLVVRFALRARRSGRALWTLAVLQAALAIGLIGLGVRQADETCAFAPTKDLRRCGCPPELIESPLECHCDGAGSVREILWPRRVMEGSIIGDRLFYGSRPAPNRGDDVTVVRETLWIDSDNRLLERTFSVDGTEGTVTQMTFQTTTGGIKDEKMPRRRHDADQRTEAYHVAGKGIRFVEGFTGHPVLFQRGETFSLSFLMEIFRGLDEI